jgi:hypothetical protein
MMARRTSPRIVARRRSRHDCKQPLYTSTTTRMEIRTWRSAIADLKTSPQGAPSGALGEGDLVL